MQGYSVSKWWSWKPNPSLSILKHCAHSISKYYLLLVRENHANNSLGWLVLKMYQKGVAYVENKDYELHKGRNNEGFAYHWLLGAVCGI